MIYVDDFTLSGPKENIDAGWKLLRKQLVIEPEKQVGGQDECLYLGCALDLFKVQLPNGQLATGMGFRMERFLRSAVDKYLALAGPGFKLRHVDTPFLTEDQSKSPQGAPCAEGQCIECPWCKHTFPPTVANDVRQVTGNRSRESADAANKVQKQPDEGRLQPIAAKVLMTVLYVARCARLDLLRPICHLACHITRWSSECDRKLHRLMCYIHSTYHLRMLGWVGDRLEDLQPFILADADFAGCTFTQRSTNGCFHYSRS